MIGLSGKTTVRYDALACIAKAVKPIQDQPEAAHGDGCRQPYRPLAIDLFCGLGGWTEGLLAEGWMIEHPIAAWTAQQTVDFVISRGVRLNPLYSMDMNRVGCMPCINCAKDELLSVSKRAPHHVARIRDWERLVGLAAKRGWTTFFADAALISLVEIPGWRKTWIDDDDDVEPYWGWIEPDAVIFDRLNIDSRIEWARTARGGRQQDFIRQQEPEACSSAYGLCE